MSYIAIPNADVAAGAPVTTALMTALRDNPIAIAEGATGAPRVTRKAMNLRPLDIYVTDSNDNKVYTGLDDGIGVILIDGFFVDANSSNDLDIRFSTDNGSSWGGWTELMSFRFSTRYNYIFSGYVQDSSVGPSVFGHADDAGDDEDSDSTNISIPAGANAFELRVTGAGLKGYIRSILIGAPDV